ncbi:Uncharacterised protein [Vibrio cholerae]|nr:Uncharacterised protein [Vibrio cholerae]CSI09531.1 Uncharacterised protein [Vibrio cholerae]
MPILSKKIRLVSASLMKVIAFQIPFKISPTKRNSDFMVSPDQRSGTTLQSFRCLVHISAQRTTSYVI